MRGAGPRSPAAGLLAALALACGDDRVSSGQQPGAVVISEIMYHAVMDDGPVEDHGFIELHNRTDAPVSLAGWRLADGVTYAFGAGATLPARGYLVVASNKQRLLADVPSYRLEPDAVAGDYTGVLDNGGERLLLVDAAGKRVDEVTYDDERPWPMAADAFGAGESWLPEALLPLEQHRWRGRSLERISADHASGSVANWAASALDGATPGLPNGAAGTPLPVIASVTAAVEGRAGEAIRASDAVRVRTTVAALGDGDAGKLIARPEIEYFVDDIERTGEPTARAALTRAGEGWEAQLPAQPAGSVVRYRVLGDRGRGSEVLAPRDSDPFAHFAYYVDPEIPGKTPVYQLFISQADWTRLFTNMTPGRVPENLSGTNPFACQLNPLWNARVPAVFVAGGKVHDVRVRYQGSFQRRFGGLFVDPTKWPADYARPLAPNPLRVFSWSIRFPRYDRFEGKRSFNLNNLTQACHGFNTMVGFELFERAGIPAARSQYVRYYVNGAYYHYMIRLEHLDDDFIQRAYGKGTPGDLFKAVGGRWDEGPYGYSDMRPLQPYCGYTLDQRYEATYARATNEDWKSGGAEMRELIEDLDAARAAGLPAVRKFFEDTFAMKELMDYMVVINWMVGWDDHYHNHFFYKRPSDGRWLMMPTDLDNVMGQAEPSLANASFFSGQWANRSNRNDYWSYLKDAFLRAFREEFIERTRQLDKTILHPDAVAALMDEVGARYQAEEAMAAPGGTSCGPALEDMNRLKRFAYERSTRLAQGLFD